MKSVPFLSIEQAALAQLLPNQQRTRVFAGTIAGLIRHRVGRAERGLAPAMRCKRAVCRRLMPSIGRYYRLRTQRRVAGAVVHQSVAGSGSDSGPIEASATALLGCAARSRNRRLWL